MTEQIIKPLDNGVNSQGTEDNLDKNLDTSNSIIKCEKCGSTENLQEKFRGLNFICNSCIKQLDESDKFHYPKEKLLSTIEEKLRPHHPHTPLAEMAEKLESFKHARFNGDKLDDLDKLVNMFCYKNHEYKAHFGTLLAIARIAEEDGLWQ